MVLTILMYSYKGGAGRTVATANIAGILAKDFKKRVVCIDLDIESAGLAVVFGMHKTLTDSGRRCLQDVLKRPGFRTDREFGEWWPKLRWDVGEANKLPQNMLLFVPSRAAHCESVEWGKVRRAGDPLDNLLTHIRLAVKPDFVLLDSASGLSDPACVGLASASCVVTFFRWNRQFMEGTIDATNFILGRTASSAKLDGITKMLLVPTAVPAIGAEETEFQHILDTNQSRLKIELEIDKDDRVELLGPIPESKWLKWEERVLPFETNYREGDREALAGYRAIAERLVEIGEETRKSTPR